MTKYAVCLVFAFVTACGSSKEFKGEGQIQPEAYDAKPVPVTETVVEIPIPPSEPPPEPKPKPDCPNPVGRVTAGSFTVWTEPACPLPFEVYDVVIEIALAPDIAAKYNPRDLSGSIVGSDGFGKGFGQGTGTVTTFKPSAEGGIFRVSLYRGADIVSDTVQINSAVLLEYQSVVINY